ncbi:MAG: C2 family cysteine protease [Streptosporangiaceae bacterium]
MSDVAGFDTVRVGELAFLLKAAGGEASGIRESISRIVANAENSAATGGYIASPPSSEPDGGALATIASETFPMSSDVSTRLQHLLACQTSGLSIDAGMYFNDEKPPNSGNVKSALGTLELYLLYVQGDSPFELSLTDVLDNWKKLTPTELDALINTMPKAQLTTLSDQLVSASRPTQIAFANLLYSEVGTGAMAKIDADMPILQPEIESYMDAQYMTVNGTLFPPGGADAAKDINVAGANDTSFLSALGTIVTQNPDFLAQHIRENANGSYTVTFYSNGKPVDITVNGTLPVSQGSMPYAETTNNVLWVAIYEKAYAQFRGGYWTFDAANPESSRTSASDALENLTGYKAYQVSTSDIGSDSDLAEQLWELGQSENVATCSYNVAGLGSVTYMIKSINGYKQNPENWTITVVDPFSSVDGSPKEMTLTSQQFLKQFSTVSYGYTDANSY